MIIRGFFPITSTFHLILGVQFLEVKFYSEDLISLKLVNLESLKGSISYNTFSPSAIWDRIFPITGAILKPWPESKFKQEKGIKVEENVTFCWSTKSEMKSRTFPTPIGWPALPWSLYNGQCAPLALIGVEKCEWGHESKKVENTITGKHTNRFHLSVQVYSEDTQRTSRCGKDPRTHCCGHIVAHDVFWARKRARQNECCVSMLRKRGNICVDNNVSSLPGP